MNPETTIARIFHQKAFQNKDTRITSLTLSMVSEYTRLFVNEAVLRANEARESEGDIRVDGFDMEDEVEEDFDENHQVDPADGFLKKSEVYENDTLDSRHLDKVAGVLVLDF